MTYMNHIKIIAFLSLLFLSTTGDAQDLPDGQLLAYFYTNKAGADPTAKTHYIQYEVTADKVLFLKCASKKKCADRDPFQVEEFSLDMRSRVRFSGRDTLYAKKHIFLPLLLEQGAEQTESSSGQGTNADLNGKFTVKITKVEGGLLYVQSRYPHNGAGNWDRDLVLKKLNNGQFLIVRDELKVYRTDESAAFPRAHIVWELKTAETTN